MKEIGRRMLEDTGDCRETNWPEQRIGLVVQRGNALSIPRNGYQYNLLELGSELAQCVHAQFT